MQSSTLVAVGTLCNYLPWQWIDDECVYIWNLGGCSNFPTPSDGENTPFMSCFTIIMKRLVRCDIQTVDLHTTAYVGTIPTSSGCHLSHIHNMHCTLSAHSVQESTPIVLLGLKPEKYTQLNNIS